MKPIPRRILQFLVLVAILGAAFFFWTRSHESSEDATTGIPAPVRVVRPDLRLLEERVTAYATVESSNQVTILPRVAGMVESLAVSVGERVSQGDVLAVVDREATALDLQRAEAAYENASSTWQRIDTLFATGGVTRQTWEEARAVYTAARAQAQQARLLYDWTRIIAPVDGTVLAVHTSVGDLVAPEAGTPLFTVGSLDLLEASFLLPEARFPEFTRGNIQVRGSAEAFDAPVQLAIKSVTPWVDPRTRTFAVDCTVSDPQGLLKPGMLIEGIFILEILGNRWSLPQGVLVGGETIWYLDDQNLARSLQWSGPSQMDQRILVDDQWADTDFILEGQHFLEEGDSVRVLSQSHGGAE